jgi:DNA-binding transcriptional MerR regulator/effector-binding domain-containing protein
MLTIGDFARLGQVSPRMLRHYDELGLLRPEHVDASSGYRYYGIGQVARLHRLMALRDLGFGLDQIGGLLDDEVPIDELRGMLRMRRAQIEDTVTTEQARLRRVEARLRSLERDPTMKLQDVVLKQTQPVRMAEASDRAAGFGEALKPVFERLWPRVLTRVARPGTPIAYYDELSDDGSVRLHTGFDIVDQDVQEGDGVTVVELPVIEVASTVHHGSMEEIESVYEALFRWIEDSGLRMDGLSRELYLHLDPQDPAASVTELQIPIAH